MRWVLVLTVILPLALTSGAAANADTATDTEPEQHCVVQVLGEDTEGNFILGPEVCFKTFAEVLTHVGVENVDPGITPATATRELLRSSSLLGVHFEHSGLRGRSSTVWGTGCTGGGFNVSSWWNDRISSTAHGLCGTIKHYEHFNYQGAVFTTNAPQGDITGVMNDKTSSIKFFS